MSALFGLLSFAAFIALIVGLIKPTLFGRLLHGAATRGKLSLIFGGTLLASFIALGATAEPSDTPKPEPQPASVSQQQESAPPIAAIPLETTSTLALETATQEGVAPTTVPSASPESETYSVVRVVDGDTIEVEINGTKESIRFIGIDTPETVDPRKPVQCFGREASAKTKSLLEGRSVRLEADSSQGERDKYNRLLRYVFLPDGTHINDLLIRQGYAHEYTYNLPYKYQAQFKQAEQEARAAKRGLWADGVCDSQQATTPPSNPPSQQQQTTPPPASPPPATPPPADGPAVKKSNSDICHDRSSRYYERTIHYTPYDTIQACLDSGGRLPEQ